MYVCKCGLLLVLRPLKEGILSNLYTCKLDSTLITKWNLIHRMEYVLPGMLSLTLLISEK